MEKGDSHAVSLVSSLCPDSMLVRSTTVQRQLGGSDSGGRAGRPEPFREGPCDRDTSRDKAGSTGGALCSPGRTEAGL